MSFLKAHDLKAYEENDPSIFLFEKLNAFVELFSFIELTTEQHPDLPHYGFRIVPNTKVSIEQNIQATFNSFPEFFLNRVLPYLHYFADRGTDFQSIDEVILIVVYYDFIAKYYNFRGPLKRTNHIFFIIYRYYKYFNNKMFVLFEFMCYS